MTWSHVQGAYLYGVATLNITNASATLSTAVSSGNIVSGFFWIESSTVSNDPISSISDDKLNTYKVYTTGGRPGVFSTGCFCSAGLITNGPSIITVNTATTQNFINIVIDEFAPPLGTTAVSFDGGSSDGWNIAATFNPYDLPTFQTLNNGDLIYSGSALSSGFTQTQGSGFTLATNNGNSEFSTEWQVQSTASATTTVPWVYSGSSEHGVSAMAISPVAQQSWTPVQNAVVYDSGGPGGTSLSLSFTNTVASGDVVVGVYFGDQISGMTVTDDKSNTYTVVTAGATTFSVPFWSNGFVNNSPKTITINFLSGPSFSGFVLAEFTPPPGSASVAIDGSSGLGGVVAANVNAGTLTTTKNGNLIFGGGGIADFPAAQDGGWSLVASDATGAVLADYLIQKTAGAVTAAPVVQSTNGNAYLSALAISFTPAGVPVIGVLGKPRRFFHGC